MAVSEKCRSPDVGSHDEGNARETQHKRSVTYSVHVFIPSELKTFISGIYKFVILKTAVINKNKSFHE